MGLSKTILTCLGISLAAALTLEAMSWLHLDKSCGGGFIVVVIGATYYLCRKPENNGSDHP